MKVYVLILGLMVATNSLARTTCWSTWAKNDLILIHKTIDETYQEMQSKENDQFIDWIEKGYEQAKLHAQRARSLADYMSVLRSYVNGFHTTQLGLTFDCEVKHYWWPGFIVQHIGNTYKISYVHTRLDHQIPLDAELIAVDGLPVKEFLSSYIMPYVEPIPGTQQGCIHPSLHMFIHNGNQWQPRASSITILVDQHQLMIPLRWKKIRASRFNKLVLCIEHEPSYEPTTIVENACQTFPYRQTVCLHCGFGKFIF